MLVFGAKSRRKVLRWHPGFAIQEQVNSINPQEHAVNGYFFESGNDKVEKGE